MGGFKRGGVMKQVLAIAVIIVTGGIWAFGASLAHEGHAEHLPDAKGLLNGECR